MSALSWKVFVTPGVATVNDDVPPGETVRMWSPISSTLIHGERDAVLVDTPTTTAQAEALADWVVAKGKNLTMIYVTHGHGDHFFGNAAVLERFPAARVIALPSVVAAMEKQLSAPIMNGLWRKRFPGLIPQRIDLAEPLDGDSFSLEGHELVAVPVGHSDTDDTSVLHVPSLGLVVAGDVAYNDVHQYFAESATHAQRLAWLAAVDKVAALGPRFVVAGHKREGNADDPAILAETRQYILAFDRLVETTSSTLELYRAMLEVYPGRINRGALWGAARAVKG